MPRVRVVVAEDSLTVRRYLCDVLARDPGIEVVGEAADGKGAIALCLEKRPDVVTMDMMMPVMTGLGATEYIMAHCPTPILVVSSSTNRGELFKTYEALAAGAVDVLEKPPGDEGNERWEQELLSTVKLVSRIPVVTHPRARLGTIGVRRAAPPPVAVPPAIRPSARALPSPAARVSPAQGPFQLAVIGASTGGPVAILDVLRALPASFPLPIVFVLHIGEAFGGAFAEWLDGQTALRVSLARDGERVSDKGGQVVMAPPGRHLAIRGGHLILTGEPARHSCRPAVDILFETAALEYGAATIGVLLTGMGRDGAAGLLAIRQAGGMTVAQDEASSVVYGMPREAVLLGAAVQELPIGQIGPVLLQLAAGPRIDAVPHTRKGRI